MTEDIAPEGALMWMAIFLHRCRAFGAGVRFQNKGFRDNTQKHSGIYCRTDGSKVSEQSYKTFPPLLNARIRVVIMDALEIF
jgi:hypothetical protein